MLQRSRYACVDHKGEPPGWAEPPPFRGHIERWTKGRPYEPILDFGMSNTTKSAGLPTFCEVGVIVGVRKGASKDCKTVETHATVEVATF